MEYDPSAIFMIKIHLITTSNPQPGWVRAGYEEYVKRLSHQCAIHLLEIPVIKRTPNSNLNRLIAKEGQQMLAAIPQGSWVVALTDKGQQWTTSELAVQVQRWLNMSCGLTLLIGGPDGLAKECLVGSKQQWSLSLLTFPHGLARILVAEQLYRAFSIINGHPYHRP